MFVEFDCAEKSQVNLKSKLKEMRKSSRGEENSDDLGEKDSFF